MQDKYERYFSWTDFLDYVDWQEPNADTRSHDTNDDGWFGTPNFNAAMHLARYGWTKFMNQVKPKDIDCWDMLNNLQLWETKHSVVGSGVDVGRYVIGMPDCMSYQDSYLNDRFHASPKFVNIVVNVTYCCSRNYKYVLKRGLDIVSTINTLEMNNVKTRIILLDNSAEDDCLYRIFIKIKDYQDIFYMEKLMFPIAHTSFLRRLIFSAEEREPKDVRKLFGFERKRGYGTPSNRFEYYDKNTLYFGTEPLYENDIKKWIRDVIDGDIENYNGHSELDEHLDKLQYESEQREISDDLKKYMQEKAERYKKVQQEKNDEEQKAIEDAAERAKRITQSENPNKEDTVEKSEQPNSDACSESRPEDSEKEQKIDNKSGGSDQTKQQNNQGKEQPNSNGGSESRPADSEKEQKIDNKSGGSDQTEQQPNQGKEQPNSDGGSESGSANSDKEQKSQGGKQKQDKKGSGSDQSKKRDNQQQSNNGIRMLPAIKQPSLLVPRTHYFPNKGGTLVLSSHYAPQGGGLPVPVSFYQQNQITR